MPRPGGPLPVVLTVVVLVVANLVSNRLDPRAVLVVGPAAAAACLLLARWDGASWADLGLARESLGRGLRWAAGSAVVAAAVYAIAVAVPFTREAFLDRRADLPASALVYHALVRVPVGTVLVEEVAFRGTLLAMGMRRWGRRPAVAVSSVLFGLWHLLPSSGVLAANQAVAGLFDHSSPARAAWTLVAVVGTAAAGAGLCELRLRTGSLLAPMGLHWAANGLAYLFAGVARTITPRAA